MARSRSTSPARSMRRLQEDGISGWSAVKWTSFVQPTARRKDDRSSLCNRPIASAPGHASSPSWSTVSSPPRAPRPTSWSRNTASPNCAAARLVNAPVLSSRSPTELSCRIGTRERAASVRLVDALGLEDDLAGVSARQQRGQRLAGLSQRENLRDQRFEPAGLPPAQQFGEVAADQDRIPLALSSPDDPDDRDVLDQDQISRDRLDATGGKADDQHPGLPVDRA